MSRLFLAVTLAITAACGPMDLDSITVTDHADALTTAANDNLFVLTLTKGTALDIADVMVTAGVAGQTATAVNFTHNDANSNGKLDVGESLSCKEPPLNLFDGTLAGKTVHVTLDTKRPNTTVLYAVASADWTAN
jgi:hypothetical protein